MAKLKPHQIKLEELQDFLAENEVTFASSSRENKRLLIGMRGNLRVTVAGEQKYIGTQPYAAVEAYNAITEIWKDPLKDFKI